MTAQLSPRTTPPGAAHPTPQGATHPQPDRLLSAEQAVGLCAVWMAVVTVWFRQSATATSWHFFGTAARLVFGGSTSTTGGGLAVYALHPKFQFGPFSIVVAEVLRVLTLSHESRVSMVPMGALAPLVLWLILDTRRTITGRAVRLRLVPTVMVTLGFSAVWGLLSVLAMHLDDALAVTLAVAAVWGVAKRSELVVGLGLGLAIAAKPWALAFLPLVLALPAGRRWRAAGLATGIFTVMWLPFVVGASGTVAALSHFTISNAPNSGLRALHITAPATPRWDRPTQMLLGGAVAAWCARTGRWPAVLMGAAAVRLAIDPGTHRYYVTGIVAFVLAWELITDRWPMPWLSLATAAALLVPGMAHVSVILRADLRLGICVVIAALAVTVAGPGPIRSSTACDDAIGAADTSGGPPSPRWEPAPLGAGR